MPKDTPQVLFAFLNYPPPLIGGAQIYWNQILTHLPLQQITVLASSKGDPAKDKRFDERHKFHTIRLPVVFTSHHVKLTKRQKLTLLFKWWQGLRHYIHSDYCDIVVMQDIYNLGLFVRILCNRKQIPYIIATYGEELGAAQNRHGLRGQLRFWLYQWVMKGAYRITAITKTTAALGEAFGIDPSKIMVIYPPTPLPSHLPTFESIQAWRQQNDLEHKQIVFSISRLIERKGYDYLLQAWSRVVVQYPDTVLVIAGDGPMFETLAQLVQTLGIESSVQLLSSIDEETKAILFSACEFFVMANRQLANGDVEGYGIVFNEASTYGKAVIGGNSGGTPEAIIDGYTGVLVDSTNIASIATAIMSMLEYPEKTKIMGENGRKWVTENRSPTYIASQFAQFVCEVVSL